MLTIALRIKRITFLQHSKNRCHEEYRGKNLQDRVCKRALLKEKNKTKRKQESQYSYQIKYFK